MIGLNAKPLGSWLLIHWYLGRYTDSGPAYSGCLHFTMARDVLSLLGKVARLSSETLPSTANQWPAVWIVGSGFLCYDLESCMFGCPGEPRLVIEFYPLTISWSSHRGYQTACKETHLAALMLTGAKVLFFVVSLTWTTQWVTLLCFQYTPSTVERNPEHATARFQQEILPD